MKKFITSSLVTITALSSLAGTVGVVGAASTSSPVETSSIVSKDKLADFSAVDMAEYQDQDFDEYFSSREIQADNIVNGNVTSKTNTVKAHGNKAFSDTNRYMIMNVRTGDTRSAYQDNSNEFNLEFNTSEFFKPGGLYVIGTATDVPGGLFEPGLGYFQQVTE